MTEHPSHPDPLMSRALGVCWHSPTADRWPCAAAAAKSAIRWYRLFRFLARIHCPEPAYYWLLDRLTGNNGWRPLFYRDQER